MQTFEEVLSKSIRISGKWNDILRYADGRVVEGGRGDMLWPSNQIQNVFANLLACWARGEAGYLQIGYMGIGHGLVAWDSVPPTLDPASPVLEDEYFRKAVLPADIYFIDPSTNLPTGGVPSPKLEVSVTLLSAEANGTMREFGLFGGTATGALDSGEIVNWVWHPRIDKDASVEIQRRVRLLFQTT